MARPTDVCCAVRMLCCCDVSNSSVGGFASVTEILAHFVPLLLLLLANRTDNDDTTNCHVIVRYAEFAAAVAVIRALSSVCKVTMCLRSFIRYSVRHI